MIVLLPLHLLTHFQFKFRIVFVSLPYSWAINGRLGTMSRALRVESEDIGIVALFGGYIRPPVLGVQVMTPMKSVAKAKVRDRGRAGPR